MIDFPASPLNGQVFVDPTTNLQWVWDGTKWKASGLSTPPLPVPMGDNRIINGDMRIDARNNGAAGNTNGYTLDRWSYTGTQASKLQWQRGSSGATLPSFPYSLGIIVQTAYTPLAGDTFYVVQPIEADMISDFAFGTSQAQAVTLSFWAASTVTGTFSGVLCNYGGGVPTRSYPFTYSIPVAATWTKIVVTIPGDTAGTWVLSGNGGAAYLRFELGGGATYRAAAGAWTNGNIVGATGSVSLVATQSATFNLTGVKLEIGSVATPYNRQSLAKSMADCQRYYQQLGGVVGADIIVSGYAAGASGSVGATLGIVTMRAAPTATRLGTWTLSNVATFNIYASPSTIGLQLLATAAGGMSAYTAVGTPLTLSAEL